MSNHCFWILNNGSIVKPDSRHILAVVAAPTAFGETEENIRQSFARHGQHSHSNYEGKAREEVLLRVIHRNHARIRKNHHKRNQYWSIQLFELTREREQAIAAWAQYISAHTEDRFADVILYQFINNTKKRTSLDQLADIHMGNERPKIKLQQELVRESKHLPSPPTNLSNNARKNT